MEKDYILMYRNCKNSDTQGRGSGKRSFPVGVTGANEVSDARGWKPYGEHSARAERAPMFDLMRLKKTVFTFKDLILFWGESDVNFVKKKIHRYVKAGKINSIRKGIYSKDKNYDRYELATKIYTPSYISLETVLGAAGITFQFYSQIFVISYQTKEIECDEQKYSYNKIKDTILTNQAGIESRENYNIASPERAFLDTIYLHKDYHFDNLSPLNWDKVREILPIYGGNKRMAKTVKIYREAFKQNIK